VSPAAAPRRRFVNPDHAWDSTQYGFSQAVVAEPGDLVFVSGQVDWDRDQRIGHGDLASQTPGAFANLIRMVEAAGASAGDVTALRIYLVADPADDTSAVSEALRRTFGPGPGPAATWIMVRGLADPSFLIEVEATAVVRRGTPSPADADA
jgi:2-iminobutanoate/2-iminopropanoate deaminase